jgi:hypothetical protein
MRRNRRIDRLILNLTARERALQCIRAVRLGRSEEPYVRQLMPPTQVHDFNRTIARANGIGHALVPSVVLLCQKIESARLRFTVLQTIVDWRADLTALARALSIPAHILIRTTAGDASHEETRAAVRRVRDDCTSLWGSLLAHRQAVKEVVAEFDDEAVLPAALRNVLIEAGTELEALHAESQPIVGKIELPSADPAVLDRLRAGFGRDERLYL